MNLEIRNMPRACSLLARAVAAKASLSTAAETLIGILSLLAVPRTIATKQQNEEFNKMRSPIGSHDRVAAAPCGQPAIGARAG
jgi:hypothetical protein